MTDEQTILALTVACAVLGLLLIRASFIAWKRARFIHKWRLKGE